MPPPKDQVQVARFCGLRPTRCHWVPALLRARLSRMPSGRASSRWPASSASTVSAGNAVGVKADGPEGAETIEAGSP